MESTTKCLNKPIKETLTTTSCDDIYFKLSSPQQIGSLKLNLQLQDYPADIYGLDQSVHNVCNYTFYSNVAPRDFTDILLPEHCVDELILNLRFKNAFWNKHANDGIYVWLSWKKPNSTKPPPVEDKKEKKQLLHLFNYR